MCSCAAFEVLRCCGAAVLLCCCMSCCAAVLLYELLYCCAAIKRSRCIALLRCSTAVLL
jgi:hypothetical protein